MTESYERRLVCCRQFCFELAKKAQNNLLEKRTQASVFERFKTLCLALLKIQTELCKEASKFTEYTPILKLCQKSEKEILRLFCELENLSCENQSQASSAGAVFLFEKRTKQIADDFSRLVLKKDKNDCDDCILRLMLALLTAQHNLCKNCLRFEIGKEAHDFAAAAIEKSGDSIEKIKYILMCIK